MNIHEYQAKELLRKFGVNTPNGVSIFFLNEIDEKFKKLNIKLHRFQLLNKFDYKKIYKNKLLYYFYKIFFLFKSLFILKHFLLKYMYRNEFSTGYIV